MQAQVHAIEVPLPEQGSVYVDFYGPRIFRLWTGSVLPAPLDATPPAEILVPDARKFGAGAGEILLKAESGSTSICLGAIRLIFNTRDGSFSVRDGDRTILPRTEWTGNSLTIAAGADAPFFGGGVQNGRFSHRGTVISIENQNSWTDGGVASPVPFLWTPGYGILWHTFTPGKYDLTAPDKVILSHETDHLDVFFILEDTPEGILKGYYQITGRQVLLPKFAF